MAKRKSATDIACGVAKVEGDALGATLHAEKIGAKALFCRKMRHFGAVWGLSSARTSKVDKE